MSTRLRPATRLRPVYAVRLQIRIHTGEGTFHGRSISGGPKHVSNETKCRPVGRTILRLPTCGNAFLQPAQIAVTGFGSNNGEPRAGSCGPAHSFWLSPAAVIDMTVCKRQVCAIVMFDVRKAQPLPMTRLPDAEPPAGNGFRMHFQN